MHNIKTPASNFKERMTRTKTRKLAGWISDLMQKIGRPLLRFTGSSDSLLSLSLSLSLSRSLSLARHVVRGTSFSLCAWGKRVFAESAEGLVVSFVLVASAERGDTFCTELRARIATFYAESSYTSFFFHLALLFHLIVLCCFAITPCYFTLKNIFSPCCSTLFLHFDASPRLLF